MLGSLGRVARRSVVECQVVLDRGSDAGDLIGGNGALCVAARYKRKVVAGLSERVVEDTS